MKSANKLIPLLISACLLGNKVRYDGQSKKDERIKKLEGIFLLIPICPETDGGLPTPRLPCEIIGRNVINSNGEDKTDFYNKGALLALKTALKHQAEYALLKENSPSCGTNFIHDGLFDNKLIKGSGKTAELLKKNGIKVFSENQIDELINSISPIDS